jgi:flagellar biosynthesis/type III secretory pathway ATPase
MLHIEQKDAFKDIRDMLASYKRDREMIRSGKFTLPSDSAAMRVMNMFQIPSQQEPQFQNSSFGADSEKI